MSLNFPLNPIVGQQYTLNNTTWVWTGGTWDVDFAGGLFTLSYESIAATGNDQTSATEITKNVVYVGAGLGGVRLPSVPSGTAIRIRNSLPGALYVYPQLGGTISGADGTNSPFTQNSYTIREYQYFGELDTWFVMNLL